MAVKLFCLKKALCPAVMLAGFFLVGVTGEVRAQSLTDILVQTYQANAAIKAARASLQSQAENLPIAQSGFLPSVDFTMNEGRTRIHQLTKDSNVSGSVSRHFRETLTDRSAKLGLTLNLYQGGTTVATVNAAEAGAMATLYALSATEQGTLQEAAVYYGDVLYYSYLLDLAKQNLNNMLALQEQADFFFNRQQITITDVAQVKTKVAAARQTIIQYQGKLASAKSSLRSKAGTDLVSLAGWPSLPPVPDTLEAAQNIGEKENPSILQSHYLLQEQKHDVDVYKGEHMPKVDFYTSLTREWDTSKYTGSEDYKEHDREDSWAIGLTMTVPIYSGGQTSAYVRQATQGASQAKYTLRDTYETIRSNINSYWTSLESYKEILSSTDGQIESARSVVEGFERQFKNGTSTMQNVLIAKGDLFSAETSKVEAEYNVYLAQVNLLTYLGRFDAANLDLSVEKYDGQRVIDKTSYFPLSKE